MCGFYKQNRCKYGISGRGCKFSHPKMCQKLLSYGRSNQKGCMMDGKCKNFHPPMCRATLSKRLCTNLKCEFMHIKGTKRFQQQKVSDARETLNRKATKTSKEKKTVRFDDRNPSKGLESEENQTNSSSTF